MGWGYALGLNVEGLKRKFWSGGRSQSLCLVEPIFKNRTCYLKKKKKRKNDSLMSRNISLIIKCLFISGVLRTSEAPGMR